MAAIIDIAHLCHFLAEIDRAEVELAGDLPAVIEALVEQDYAAAGFSDGAYWLRLCGVRTSCTSGHHGLLRNWQNAARRKIAAAGCPGHVASLGNSKVCGRCGAHVDEERGDDVFNPFGSGPVPVEARGHTDG